MALGAQWRSRQIAAMPEFGTAKMAGLVSAVLFLLCGLLVATFGAFLPAAPHVHPLGVVVIGLLAAVSGIAIAALPWQRWPRSSSLWLIPVAFTLIALHNFLSGDNGIRYDVFFFVVFVWIGLMHPGGTAVKSAPLLLAAYLAPAIWLHDFGTLMSGLAYAMPVCVLVGECASLVAARIHHSEDVLRSSEQRFRALVHNSSDVITVVDVDGRIQWDSASVSRVLGFEPDERIGLIALDQIHPDHVDEVHAAFEQLQTTRSVASVEIQVRHRDGSWRWCDVRITDLADDPAVGGTVVNLTDVTGRHEAEAVRRQLAAIVESSTDAITGQRLDGTVLSWNPAAERMYLCPTEQMLGCNIRSIVPAECLGELDDLLARVARGEEVAAVETRRRRRDGVVLDVSLSMAPLRDSHGNVVALAAIARDITEEVRARKALADREASFRLLFAANPQPMWVYDATTMAFLEVNDAAVRHYGYSRDQFLAMTVNAVRAPGDRERHVLADRRVIDVDTTTHQLEFAGHDAVLVAARDVTDRNALEAQLRHQAFHDSLTGLSNRALFGDRVDHALGSRERSGSVTVLLLDLDRFKLVNDSLGHAAGDHLLVEVSNRLRECLRTGDTVARLGGDEFAVLLEQCPRGTADRQAQRLLAALSTPMVVGGRELTVTASIGIAMADASMSAGELLRNADVAMYRAKAAGGATYRFFHPAMQVAAARELDLTGALRSAIGTDQLVLHFQPVVDATTGRVAALEALTRWEHPELGLLNPAEFIPVAEDSGLILPLGEWVLQTACAAAATWPAEAGSVHVNLSARQLADPEVVDHVRSALEDSGLAPHRLTLEITESVVMQNSDSNMRRLRRLRDLGVVLSIDDFGTGYSSLAYLRAFPVHELKIDKSFVAAIPHDEDALTLVATILQLARSLSMSVVAEGVESVAQYAALQRLGCQRIQGYYVSKPVRLDEAIAIATGPATWHVPTALPAQRRRSRNRSADRSGARVVERVQP